MMPIRRNLLILLLGMAWPSLLALAPAMLWVLLCRTPLFVPSESLLPCLFIVLHSLAIVTLPGKPRYATGAFLYGRGFSRDTLWGHQMLASVLAALAVWLPVALLVWTPARSTVQDELFRSPYYPLLAPREDWIPWRWLAGYGLLLPVFHYAWIRRGLPARGSDAGSWLAVGDVLLLFTILEAARGAFAWLPWLQPLCWGIMTVTALGLLLAGWRLHRELEVLP